MVPCPHIEAHPTTSDLLLTPSTTCGDKPIGSDNARQKVSSARSSMKAKLNGEVIPDSEDERRGYKIIKYRTIIDTNIIEISSGEEEDNPKYPLRGDSFISEIPGAWPAKDTNTYQSHREYEVSIPKTSTTVIRTPEEKKYSHARRIVEISSSEDSDNIQEVIELSDSSLELPNPLNITLSNRPKTATSGIHKENLLFFADLDDINDDDAIMTLNEPRSARKPIRFTTSLTQSSSASPAPSTPHEAQAIYTNFPGLKGKSKLSTDPTFIGIPSQLGSYKDPVTSTPSKPPAKTKQPPSTGKKARTAIEQARREAYAQQVFTELNRIVFKDGLPKGTKLNWNKRLLTTAGRAKWHKSRDGIQSTEIELAEKILDCDERIRNTLSHEMCHLASWIIDGDPKEGHGRLWKSWASKVMRKRPEIEITTRHDYEISYPFKWECEKCSKIYGRFSKSIRPDECVCGACKEGKLIPLFLVPAKTPKTPKMSRMASVKPQDSPSSVPHDSRVLLLDNGGNEAILQTPGSNKTRNIQDSDSESSPDIEVLTTIMGSVTLDNKTH